LSDISKAVTLVDQKEDAQRWKAEDLAEWRLAAWKVQQSSPSR
jgi:hypothetical protein